MIVYGRNPVREALRGPRRVTRVWVGEAAGPIGWLRDPRELQPALEAAGGLLRAPESELESLCGSPEHQGLCARVERFRYADPAALLGPAEALVLCLDEVKDPHNLGAVCRVAESAGAAGVVIGERRSAQVTPAVCKASAGAVEHVAVARAPNLAEYLAVAKKAGAWVYGAAADAPLPYDRPDYGGRVVLVLGSEETGLRPRVARACDELVALPVRGKVGSLNVSTAAAALVYGILHLRGSGS